MDTNPHVATTIRDLQRLRGQARGFSFLPRQPVQSLLSGKHASRIRGRGLDFEELRHYRIGDDVRTIDWRVTNRTRKPHVRVYTEERDRPCFVVLDQRRSMFFGSRLKMKSVTAAETAALAAWRVIEVADRVGGLVFNEADMAFTRPQRSSRNVLHFLGHVETFNHALTQPGAPVVERPLSLADVLRRTAQLCPHDYMIMLVSDFAGWDEEAARQLRLLARHNDLLAAHISDPLERELPADRSFVVSDGERQIEVDGGALAEQYRSAFQGEVERIAAELRRHDIPVLSLDTADEVAPQVRAALGRVEATR